MRRDACCDFEYWCTRQRLSSRFSHRVDGSFIIPHTHMLRERRCSLVLARSLRWFSLFRGTGEPDIPKHVVTIMCSTDSPYEQASHSVMQ